MYRAVSHEWSSSIVPSLQFPLACLLLPVRPLLSVNLLPTWLNFPAAPSKANLFSMLMGVPHFGVVLSVLFWAWFFFPCLFPSPISQIKIKLAQTQGLYKFCSSDSKAGKGETEQNPWSSQNTSVPITDHSLLPLHTITAPKFRNSSWSETWCWS